MAGIDWDSMRDVLAAEQFMMLHLNGLRAKHRVFEINIDGPEIGRLLGAYLDNDHDSRVVLSRKDGLTMEEVKWHIIHDYYDFIIAHNIFTHAPLPAIGRLLFEMRWCCMNHSSIFLATYINGASDSKATEWIYPETVAYKQETLAALARNNGLEMSVIKLPHPMGHEWVKFELPVEDEPEQAIVNGNPLESSFNMP